MSNDKLRTTTNLEAKLKTTPGQPQAGIDAAVANLFEEMDAEMVECKRGVWTLAHLRTAFEAVQNPENWKLPFASILRNVTIDHLNLTMDAIEFFTGGTATLGIANGYRGKDGVMRYQAYLSGAGYYNHIGA